MPDRSDIHEQLSAYLDGELDENQARRVEEAVRGDTRLALELSKLRAARDLLRRLPREEAGEDFTARVLEQAERRQLVATTPVHPVDGKRRPLRVLAAAAVLLVAAGVGVIVTARLLTGPDGRPGGPEPIGELARDTAPPQPALRAAGDREAPTLADGANEVEEPTAPPAAELPSDRTAPERLARAEADPVPPRAPTDGRAPADGEETVVPPSAIEGFQPELWATAVANEIIETHDLDQARRDVERVLESVEVQPASYAETPEVRDRPRYYPWREEPRRQIIYVVVGQRKDLAAVQSRIRRLQARQGSRRATGRDATGARKWMDSFFSRRRGAAGDESPPRPTPGQTVGIAAEHAPGVTGAFVLTEPTAREKSDEAEGSGDAPGPVRQASTGPADADAAPAGGAEGVGGEPVWRVRVARPGLQTMLITVNHVRPEEAGTGPASAPEDPQTAPGADHSAD